VAEAPILPVVQGSGSITGRGELYLDPADPPGDGFLLR
jgi:proline racemase